MIKLDKQQKSIDNVISLAIAIKKKKEKIGFFDLETQNLFVDLEPKWNSLSSKEKEKLRFTLIPKMKISIAGILTINKQDGIPVYTYYSEDEVKKLEKDLKELDKIVGHNLFRFDFHVLAPYISQESLDEIKSKTIDTWKLLEDETKEWMKLDDLGNLNFGVTKTVDTLKIPQMWRDGKYEEVKEYLKRDLDILASVFYYGISQTSMTYYKKNYGKVIGTRSKIFNWEQLID